MLLAEDSLTFWNVFFLFLIYIPLVLLWAFALVDIFRRDDIGGAHKALWVLVVIIIPFVGTLVYLLFRPTGATAFEREVIAEAQKEAGMVDAPTSRVGSLQALADLHDRGKLTDEEFAAEKARLTAG